MFCPAVTVCSRTAEAANVEQQSERSPSENKERAYVAASRRGDRSIEARVESAKAASKIHFERTGKRLKISEEIVRKEEMYEEEDDHLPMAYRNVAFRQDIPQKFRDYSVIHMGMRQFGGSDSDAVDAMVKQDNEARVNSLFAAAFPGMSGFQQPRRQTDASMPEMSPTPFQPSDFISNEWHSNSAISPASVLPTVQSPGMAPFLPEMQRGVSHSPHGMVRTPSHESMTMHRHGSTSSVRSAASMERQGSGASTTLSRGASAWPPVSPCSADYEGFFGGPHSATTPIAPSHGMPSQLRSMSVPFPNEPRGSRRRREDEGTSALPSPSYGLSIVSPNQAVPPAKRNRSDAGLASARSNRTPSTATPFPFSREMPGNVQGMILQSPSIDYQLASSAAQQQALAHGRFQQGLVHQHGTQAVPRLRPPPRKGKGPSHGQTETPTQPRPRTGSSESDMSLAETPQLEELSREVKAEAIKKQATMPGSPTASPAEVAPTVENQAEQDEPFVFNGSMGGVLDPFDSQSDANCFSEFNFTADGNMSDWNMDGSSFNFDDLLQFPASQPEE